MIRRTRSGRFIMAGLPAALAVGLCLAAFALMRADGAPPTETPPPGPELVSSEDQQLAAELVAQAEQSAKRGDRAAAAQQGLRAVRWDPSRLRDYRRAVGHLEAVDPAAAVRHAAILLDRDPAYGIADRELLVRLKRRASEIATFESWDVAARLSQRLAEVGAVVERPDALRLTGLWLDAGMAYATAGRAAEASAAFERYQVLVANDPEPAESSESQGEIIAVVHLEAGELGRAAAAIESLATRRGDTPGVAALRARLAMATGEPLTAVEHAQRAIELSAADDPPPYALLAESLRAANQSDQAVARFSELLAAHPDDAPLAMALVSSLAATGAIDLAVRQSEQLQTRLLERLPWYEPLSDPTTADQEGLLELLAEATMQRIGLAVRSGSPAACLDRLPDVAARLGSLDALADPIAVAANDTSFRAAATVWVADLAKRADEAELPLGSRRAAMGIASAVGEYTALEQLARARAERALATDADPAAVAREIGFVVSDLLGSGAAPQARKLAGWALGRLAADADGLNAEGEPLLEVLRTELAEALAHTLPSGAEERERTIREITDLLAAAERGAPKDAYLTQSALFTLADIGELDAAIAVGERFVGIPLPKVSASDVGPAQRRDAVIRLAMALRQRGGEEDLPRAIELYEQVLDRWPGDPGASLRLAECFADQGVHLQRAERMARRALAERPEWPESSAALGWVRFKQGDAPEGATLLERAVQRVEAGAETDPYETGVIRTHLVEVLGQLGRAEEAAAGQTSPDR